jgi:hypothetical protein
VAAARARGIGCRVEGGGGGIKAEREQRESAQGRERREEG